MSLPPGLSPAIDVDRLRHELIDHLDVLPFKDWSPGLLRAVISVLKVAGASPISAVAAPPQLRVVQGGA